MKVFFAVSLRAHLDFAKEYKQIYDLIEKFGYKNLNSLPITNDPKGYYSLSESELLESHITLSKHLKNADIVVIDATIHSLTMGYYIKMALDLDKPTIVLYQPGSKPYYFSAIQNDRLQILEYTSETLPMVLKGGLDYAREDINIRFNLFLTSDLYNYLKWAAKQEELQSSSFIRNLLVQHRNAHLEQYENDLKK